jgi:protein gp37
LASRGLDWIIVGGESGPGARHFNIGWARQTVEECRDAGVACFVKQLGARPTHPPRDGYPAVNLQLKDRKGGDMEEWPADLRVREFPQPRGTP